MICSPCSGCGVVFGTNDSAESPIAFELLRAQPRGPGANLRLARRRAAVTRPSSRFAAPALELGERHNPRLSQRRQAIPFDTTGRAEKSVIRSHEHCAASKNVGIEEPRGSQV